jgi:acetyl-CoA carboxylase alpha subunit
MLEFTKPWRELQKHLDELILPSQNVKVSLTCEIHTLEQKSMSEERDIFANRST